MVNLPNSFMALRDIALLNKTRREALIPSADRQAVSTTLGLQYVVCQWKEKR